MLSNAINFSSCWLTLQLYIECDIIHFNYEKVSSRIFSVKFYFSNRFTSPRLADAISYFAEQLYGRCMTPPILNNTELSFYRDAYGAVAVYTCISGHSFPDSSGFTRTLICSNGQWNTLPEPCEGQSAICDWQKCIEVFAHVEDGNDLNIIVFDTANRSIQRLQNIQSLFIHRVDGGRA